MGGDRRRVVTGTVIDEVTREPASARARQAGWLFVAAGLFTVVNDYLPGSEHLDAGLLDAIGVVAIAIGLLTRLLPWDRWPGRAALAFAPLAFALIAVANRFGGVSDFSYATYFVLVFTWIGLAFGPRTSLLMAPLATLAYVLPGLTAADAPAGSVSSVTVAIPVCVLVAETIARTMRRVGDAVHDVTEQTTAVREAEERFRLAFINAPIGMALTSLEGRFLQVNGALCAMLDRPEAELVGATVPSLTHPDDQAADRAAMQAMRDGKQRIFATEKRYLRADGAPVWVKLHAGVVVDDDCRPLYFVSQMEDITESKRTEAALQASEERTRRILETAGDAFVALDEDGRITDWNRQAEVTFGWGTAAVLGRRIEDVLIPPDLREAHRRGLERFLATGEGPVLGRRLELRALHRSGGEIPIELVVWALREGDQWSFNAFLRDISQRKAMEEELQRLALVDGLTGLRNRRGFLAAAEPVLHTSRRDLREPALLYIDLDNMKELNDRYGHRVGDQALMDTAALLQATFRESDIIARLGGDESSSLTTAWTPRRPSTACSSTSPSTAATASSPRSPSASAWPGTTWTILARSRR
jgi:PAS domain S-box-containing protein